MPDLEKEALGLRIKSGYKLRRGQALMLVLHDLRPDLYHEITGTKWDCFYKDSVVDAFFEFLNERGYQ